MCIMYNNSRLQKKFNYIVSIEMSGKGSKSSPSLNRVDSNTSYYSAKSSPSPSRSPRRSSSSIKNSKTSHRSPNSRSNSRTLSGISLARSDSNISLGSRAESASELNLREFSDFIHGSPRWDKVIKGIREQNKKSHRAKTHEEHVKELYVKIAKSPRFKKILEKSMSDPNRDYNTELVPLDLQIQKDKNKCFYCNDKLIAGLPGFFGNSSLIKRSNKCKHCGKYYCAAHLMPDHHNCIKYLKKKGSVYWQKKYPGLHAHRQPGWSSYLGKNYDDGTYYVPQTPRQYATGGKKTLVKSKKKKALVKYKKKKVLIKSKSKKK